MTVNQLQAAFSEVKENLKFGSTADGLIKEMELLR